MSSRALRTLGARRGSDSSLRLIVDYHSPLSSARGFGFPSCTGCGPRRKPHVCTAARCCVKRALRHERVYRTGMRGDKTTEPCASALTVESPALQWTIMRLSLLLPSRTLTRRTASGLALLRGMLLALPLFCSSCDTLLTDIVREAFDDDRSNSTYFDQNHPDQPGALAPLPRDDE